VISCNIQGDNNMRSDRIKKGLERVPHRALLYATGLDKKRMPRNQI
jgi:dihydroxyacid dehydratase/phosphogluconate dehydratase